MKVPAVLTMPPSLQWGRDRQVADRPARWRGTSRAGCCFNGAATVRSRIDEERPGGRLGQVLLQWGRDRQVADRAAVLVVYPLPCPRFNGAATVRSRIGV